MELSGIRHVLVTGGASGIGLGIVEAFLERGVTVTAVDIIRDRLDAQFAGRGEQVLPYELDVRDRAGWIEAKRAAEARFGPVDVLVNNAGIGPDGHELADLDPEAFDRMIAIDLTGVFNGVHMFAADMRARGRGHIVNTASMNGIAPGMKLFGSYATAKHAVVGLSEALREELAPHGVGVSVLCPGPVASAMPETSRLLGHDSLPRWPAERMPPIIAGRQVVRAVELNLGYVFTHPGMGGAAASARGAAIAADAGIQAGEWPALPGYEAERPMGSSK